jgi:Na+/melibiose symporter-like transporter
VTLSILLLVANENVITYQLVNVMGMKEENVGFFFCIIGVTYICFSPFTPKLTKYMSRRIVLFIGISLLVIANLLLGPCGDVFLP